MLKKYRNIRLFNWENCTVDYKPLNYVLLLNPFEHLIKNNFLQKYNRLVHVSNCLGDLMSQKTLSQILITRHIGDILAAYIQLSFAPLKKPSAVVQNPVDETTDDQKSIDEPSIDETSDDSKPVEDKSEFVMTNELFERFTRDQADFGARLKSIIEKVIKTIYVFFLLFLLSLI